MYPLITFSYKRYLLDKQYFYEYVLQGTIFIYNAGYFCDQNILNLMASYIASNILNCYASQL